MAATSMTLAGLEIGCAVDLPHGRHGVVRDIRDKGLEVSVESMGTFANYSPREIRRSYNDAQQARQARYAQLITVFPDAYDHSETDTLERYCAPCGEHGASTYAYVWGDTFEMCARSAADRILDEGWFPEAIYDLDTGARIELHVASPVITRSEDQGVCINVLDFDGIREGVIAVHNGERVQITSDPAENYPMGFCVSAVPMTGGRPRMIPVNRLTKEA